MTHFGHSAIVLDGILRTEDNSGFDVKMTSRMD